MTSQYTLSAVKRENLGKRASKRYRRDNLVPAEIYGSKENKSVLIDAFELNNSERSWKISYNPHRFSGSRYE